MARMNDHDGTAHRHHLGLRLHISESKAVPVPEHGRLGDLDEIVRYKERLVVDADKINPAIRYVVDTKYIDGTPTIIPADKAAEG